MGLLQSALNGLYNALEEAEIDRILDNVCENIRQVRKKFLIVCGGDALKAFDNVRPLPSMFRSGIITMPTIAIGPTIPITTRLGTPPVGVAVGGGQQGGGQQQQQQQGGNGGGGGGQQQHAIIIGNIQAMINNRGLFSGRFGIRRETNEEMAHELALDPNYQIDENGLHLDEHDVKLRNTLNAALWDSLVSDLSQPYFHRFINSLRDIRDMI